MFSGESLHSHAGQFRGLTSSEWEKVSLESQMTSTDQPSPRTTARRWKSDTAAVLPLTFHWEAQWLMREVTLE